MKHSPIRGATAGAIAASVEQAVNDGAFAAGQPLPPIRQLAASLHVSPVTVAGAYRLLRARGLAAGDGRRGTRIRPQPLPAAPPTAAPPLGAGVIDLASGNPDPELLPPLEPALRAVDARPHLYGEPRPFRPLLTFAAGELAADGIPSQTLAIVSGGFDGIERILQGHIRPGDRVGVEDPALPGLVDLLDACGYPVEPIPVDASGPEPDAFARALRRRLRAVVVTARAHNPTGAALTAARAAELKRLLRKHREVLVIENDPAGPVAGVPLATLCDGSPPLWAVVRSTSTFLGPDLRVGVVAGDPLTMARVQRRQALGVRWVSHLLQQVVLALWSDPSSGRRLARAADVYVQRRSALLAALQARGVSAAAASGFNVWLPVRAETAMVQALAYRGWAVAAGERFRLRTAPAIRVTTSALSAAAAERFAADFDECSRSSGGASW